MKKPIVRLVMLSQVHVYGERHRAKNPDGVLELQGPNSRAGYRIRFTCVQDVVSRGSSFNACKREAIDVEKAGLKIEMAKNFTTFAWIIPEKVPEQAAS